MTALLAARRVALVRTADVLRAQVEVMLLLEPLATPGPWDKGDGCVIAPSEPCDNDDRTYYGGQLVCESIQRTDALLVVVARNLMPDLGRAYLKALEELHALRLHVEIMKTYLREQGVAA